MSLFDHVRYCLKIKDMFANANDAMKPNNRVLICTEVVPEAVIARCCKWMLSLVLFTQPINEETLARMFRQEAEMRIRGFLCEYDYICDEVFSGFPDNSITSVRMQLVDKFVLKMRDDLDIDTEQFLQLIRSLMLKEEIFETIESLRGRVLDECAPILQKLTKLVE